MKVATLNGDLDMADLEVRDIVSMSDNARTIATEWRHRGELVRRDVCVLILRPTTLGVAHGE